MTTDYKAVIEQAFKELGELILKREEADLQVAKRLQLIRATVNMLPDDERGTWINYFKLCILMTRAVRRLHAAGLAHSDLSCRNILVDPSNGQSVVIDIDSLVVPRLFPPDVAGTPGYIAPEVLSTIQLDLRDPNRILPSTGTDQHALPVLIYELDYAASGKVRKA